MRKTSFATKVLATACSTAMAVALVPAVALADDATTATASDGNPVVLTVQTAQLKTETNSKGVATQTPDATTAKVIKTYSQAQLEKLASENTTTQSYQFAKGTAGNVITTSSYVTFDQLLGGLKNWNAKAIVNAGAADSSVAFTYAQVTGENYFFPNYASGTFDTSGAVRVPTALALSMKSGAIEGEDTAANAVSKLASATAETDKAPRVVIGETQAEYAAGNLLRGMNFWSNVSVLSVGPSDGSAPLDESAKTDDNTKVTKAANTVKVANSKVTVKKGKTKKVAVKGAKGKVTVKSSNKKVAKVSYSKKTKKVTIKGVKKGKAKVTVKAAGNGKYKAGSKTIKVTVK